jgi:hypothetical protein
MNPLKKHLIYLVLLGLCVMGCQEIRPANRLTLEPVQPSIDGEVHPIDVSFRDVVWTPEGEDVAVVGYGVNGHDTLIVSEGQTPGQPRHFYISRDANGAPGHEYLITVVAASSLFQVDPYSAPNSLIFQGTLPAPTKLMMDQMQFTLDRLPLAAPNNEGLIGSVFLSGRIVAKFTSQAGFMDKKAPFVTAATTALEDLAAYSSGRAQAQEELDLRP